MTFLFFQYQNKINASIANLYKVINIYISIQLGYSKMSPINVHMHA